MVSTELHFRKRKYAATFPKRRAGSPVGQATQVGEPAKWSRQAAEQVTEEVRKTVKLMERIHPGRFPSESVGRSEQEGTRK